MSGNSFEPHVFTGKMSVVQVSAEVTSLTLNEIVEKKAIEKSEVVKQRIRASIKYCFLFTGPLLSFHSLLSFYFY
jgi:hypothetical protein